MLLAAMDAWGVGIASAKDRPPVLDRNAARTKVTIIGAGLAGMAAAYELAKFGYDCQIIEARSFAGGRCQTARVGTEISELGGVTQRCGFDAGLYFNHGPWRIPYHHRSTLHYCKEFQIPLEIMVNDNDAAYLYQGASAKPLSGRRMRRLEIKADIRGYASEILAKITRAGRLDDALTADDREELISYLLQTGHIDRNDLAYRGTTARGYGTRPGAGMNPGTRSDPHDFLSVLRSGLGRKIASVPEFSQPPTMFQPVGGMDVIAKAFEERLAGRIRYGVIVERIRSHESGVETSFRDLKTQSSESVTSDYCICTIPLSVLKLIDGGFSEPFRSAMDGVSYVPTAKIGLQMKRRFWEEDDHIYGGHTWVDSIGNISYPSTGWLGEKGIVQGLYNFNLSAIRLSALVPADRIEFALTQGEKVHPPYRAEFETGFSVAWHRVKFSLGGWSNWSQQSRERDYPVLNEPDGRVYLAGEHLSYLNGWMAGAFESAWEQIGKLHRRAREG